MLHISTDMKLIYTLLLNNMTLLLNLNLEEHRHQQLHDTLSMSY